MKNLYILTFFLTLVVFSAPLSTESDDFEDYSTDDLEISSEDSSEFSDDESNFLTESDSDSDDAKSEPESDDLFDESVLNWEEPHLYSTDDLRKLLKLKASAQISNEAIACLVFTNNRLLRGETTKIDLKENCSGGKTSVKQYSRAEAAMLDKKTPLSVLEQIVLQFTNNQLVSEGPKTDLRENFNEFLAEYDKKEAKGEAEFLFKHLKKFFAKNKDEVVGLLMNRSVDEIEILKKHFKKILEREKMDSICYKYDSCLEKWIKKNLSGGWEKKALAGYYVHQTKDDSAFFWTSRAATYWNEYLKESDKAARKMIESGGIVQKAVGYANRGLFGTAGFVNSQVSQAQSIYIGLATSSDGSAIVKGLAKGGFVMATIAGTFGTKALDPTLSPVETREGLIELAMFAGSMGFATIVQSATKTATGIALLTKLANKISALKKGLFSAKKVGNLSKLSKKALKLSDRFAKRAKRPGISPTKKKELLEASKLSKRIGVKAAAADELRVKAVQTNRLLKDLQKIKKADQGLVTAETAWNTAQELQGSVNSLKGLVTKANKLNRSIRLERGTRSQAFLVSILGRIALTIGQAGKESKKVHPSKFTSWLFEIVQQTVKPSRSRISTAQFNALLDQLFQFAKKNRMNAVEKKIENKEGLYVSIEGPISNELFFPHLVRIKKGNPTDFQVGQLLRLFFEVHYMAVLQSGAVEKSAVQTLIRYFNTHQYYPSFHTAVTGKDIKKEILADDFISAVKLLLKASESVFMATSHTFPHKYTFDVAYSVVLFRDKDSRTVPGVENRLNPMVFAALYGLDSNIKIMMDLLHSSVVKMQIQTSATSTRAVVDAILEAHYKEELAEK